MKAVELNETELEIIRTFRFLYNKGLTNEHIYNHVAWALYWTWRDLEMWGIEIDRKEADDA